MPAAPDLFARLSAARELLADAGEAGPPIAEIARAAHLSPFHFIRRFQAVFGVTPHQFRIGARLDRAKYLLAMDAASVTDICLDSGWTSLGSFSTSFTRRFGVPPSAYRRRARSLVRVAGIPPVELFPGCLSLMTRLPAGSFRQDRKFEDRNFQEAGAPLVR